MRATFLVALALLAQTGCDDGSSALPDQGLYTDGGFTSATIEGYVWDPEVFWNALASCPPVNGQCPLPPIILPGTPLYGQAAVANALVGLFDPTQPTQTMPLPYMAEAPTRFDGGWDVVGVPLRPAPPFFAVAATIPGMGADGGAGPVTHYFPTLTGKPIATRTTLCLAQSTGIVGDTGVLDAVAKFLTLTGHPTTAADLVDPTKTGGVAVFWLFMPGPSALRVPAFGSTVTADQGQSFTVSWLPPGTLPPTQLAPGLVTFFELQAVSPGAAPAPDWVCLP